MFISGIVVAALILQPTLSKLVLNKCCPAGEILDSAGGTRTCVKADFNTTRWSWFPPEAIVNATTLMDSEHLMEQIEREVDVEFRFPICKDYPNNKLALFGDFGSVEDGAHWRKGFYVIADEQKGKLDLKIYVAEEDSFHNSDDIVLMGMPHVTNATYYENATKKENIRTFPLSDVCIDQTVHPKFFMMAYCPCNTMLCIQKCCHSNEFFNASSQQCETLTEALGVPLWKPQSDSLENIFLLVSSQPTCENKELNLLKHPCSFDTETDNQFHFHINGSIKINKYRRLFARDQYCGEATWHSQNHFYEQNLYVCVNIKPRHPKHMLYGGLFIIGGICLLATVAISLLLPQLHKRRHNKIALTHNATLMVAYFAWGISQLLPETDKPIWVCYLFSLLIQFTFLGSFFWLNAMCIDMSAKFRASMGRRFNASYATYSLYTWGCTLLITIITIIMEFSPTIPRGTLRPGFTCSCGFTSENAAILIYFYGPMAILLLINLILFVYTAANIMLIQKQTAVLHKTDSNTAGGSSVQTDKQRLIVYAKLFLLMGLTWATEILSWAVGGGNDFWIITDVVNLLRAVFIFVLFICKRPILASLKNRLLHKDQDRKISTTEVVSVSTARSSVISRIDRKKSREENGTVPVEQIEMKQMAVVAEIENCITAVKGHATDHDQEQNDVVA